MLRNKFLFLSAIGAAVASTLGHSAPPAAPAIPEVGVAPVSLNAGPGAGVAEPLSDAELEQKIEDAKPTAPRITKEHIQSLIVDETYTNLEGTRTTVCRLQLANGFCVVGINNGPVSAANFSQEIGCEYAYKAAVDQIWPLEGYLLAERLFAGDVNLEKVAKLRDLLATQRAQDPSGQDGYMRGMANGLVVALAVFDGQEPQFVEQPATSHQDRVRAEKSELDERIAKLDVFFTGTVYAGLDTAEQGRLNAQRHAMSAYSAMLEERIAAF
jgi:hypothetical protein